MFKIRRFKILPLLIIASIISACSSNTTVTEEDLIHHRFVVTKINHNDISFEKTAYIEFGENLTINGKMCNDFMAKATFDNYRLNTTNFNISKQITCNNQQLNQLDLLITQLLTNRPTIKLIEQENKLLLSLTDNVDILTFELKDWM